MKYKLQLGGICISPLLMTKTNYTITLKENLKILVQQRPLSGNLILVVGVYSLFFCDIFPIKVLGFEFENS